MTYEGFQKKVNLLINSGNFSIDSAVSVEFHEGNGYFAAKLSNGHMIIGNPSLDSVRIRWENKRNSSRV